MAAGLCQRVLVVRCGVSCHSDRERTCCGTQGASQGAPEPTGAVPGWTWRCAFSLSRQTISNWETDRTYPDVQSLLLLSEIFGTSIDELVKGDVATMEKAIENDWKTMSRLTVAAWALVGVGLVCVAVGFAVPTAPSSLMPKCTESEVLGIVLFLALWVLGCILLGMVESMKKKYDLVTYRDIVAYSRGEEPVRDNEAFGRKHPVASAGLKMGVSAVSGFVVAYVVLKLILG